MQGINFSITYTILEMYSGNPLSTQPSHSLEITEETSRVTEQNALPMDRMPIFFTYTRPIDFLLYLCKRGASVECVAALLNRGVDVDARAKNGITPLMEAIRHGKFVIAQLLLEADADPTLTDISGKTALHYLMGNDFIHPDFINRLIERGADINSKDGEGNTPLHYAYLLQVSKEVIDQLINKGAKPDIKNEMGSLPVDMQSGAL